MFSKQLKKILQLSKQTGDRVIIFDSANPDDTYIVSHLDAYMSERGILENNEEKVKKIFNENSLKNSTNFTNDFLTPNDLPVVEKADISEENKVNQNLTDEDLTDKINREISMWKNQANAATLSEEDKVKKSWQIPPAVKDKAHNIE